MTNKQMEDIYHQYYPELYAYAYSLCQNHHLAQDLTSETFFKAMLSLPGSEYVKYWLFRVCRNMYIDQFRSERTSFYNIDQSVASDQPSPLDQVLASEDRRALYHSLLGLAEADREILSLFYFSAFSLSDIAHTMGISYRAAKTRLFRARRRLKQAMEETNGF